MKEEDYVARQHSSRELAYAGLFGAAALVLPVLFHVFQLGRLFLPMYLPLVTLAFLVRPLPAVLTSVITPLLSALVTGMPPLYPPVAASMAVELGAMAGAIAALCGRWPRVNVGLLLGLTLAAGRVIGFGVMYGFARLAQLPAAFTAGLSIASGWPGLVLMLVTVPPIVRIVRQSSQPAPVATEKTRP